MFTSNPFSPLIAFIHPAAMQAYVVLMILAVVLGTVYDLVHDRKVEFFLRERARARRAATRQLGAAEWAALLARTVLIDIATFGEFCNRRRRLSHALMFYGFLLYLATTLVMVFCYPGAMDTPVVLPVLWNVGVLMALAGGYWFFLFLRVNVVHDGHSPWRLEQADLFIFTLLGSLTSALLLAMAGATENVTAIKWAAGLYVSFTTVLCVSVPWSKFAHMFYKPVVAVQRRVEEADGSTDLPAITTPGGERCPHSHT